jgi:hypothetical protein
VGQAVKALSDSALMGEHYSEQGKGVLRRTSIEQLVQDRSTAFTEQDLADQPPHSCKISHFKSAVNSGAAFSDKDMRSVPCYLPGRPSLSLTATAQQVPARGSCFTVVLLGWAAVAAFIHD